MTERPPRALQNDADEDAEADTKAQFVKRYIYDDYKLSKLRPHDYRMSRRTIKFSVNAPLDRTELLPNIFGYFDKIITYYHKINDSLNNNSRYIECHLPFFINPSTQRLFENMQTVSQSRAHFARIPKILRR